MTWRPRPQPGGRPLSSRRCGAQRDLVDAADLERAVVEAGTVGLQQGQVVVVGRAAQERDDAVAAVRELEPEHARVEVDLLVERPGEQQDVPEPSRMASSPSGHPRSPPGTTCPGLFSASGGSAGGVSPASAGH